MLWTNLISAAGEWSGFDEDWMVEIIIDSLERRNKLKDLIIKLVFKMLKGGFSDDWDKVEAYMREE